MRYLFLCLLCWGAGSAWAAGGDTLTTAIAQVEQVFVFGVSLFGPHEPGCGWFFCLLFVVVGLIEGSGDARSGVVGTLKQMQGGLNQEAAAAVDAALAYLQAAAEHARRAVQAKSIDETHAEARLATGLLVAARGVAGAKSPVTGALEYARRHP